MGSEATAQNPAIRMALGLDAGAAAPSAHEQGAPSIELVPPEDGHTPLWALTILRTLAAKLQEKPPPRGAALGEALQDLTSNRAEVVAQIQIARRTRPSFAGGELAMIRACGQTKLIDDLEKDIKRGPGPDLSNKRAVRSIFPDAPVSGALVVPSKWDLDPSGILRDGQQVASLVVVVSAATDDDQLHLCVRKGGAWVQLCVDASATRDPSQLLKLVSLSKEQAGKVASFLTDMCNENVAAGTMPTLRVVSRQLWDLDEDGRPIGFVYSPTTYIVAGGIADNPPKTMRVPASMKALADGLKSHGDPAAWRKMVVDCVVSRPVMGLAIMAAIAGLLVTFAERPNFWIELCAQGGTGKSTFQKLYMSCVGSRKALIGSWNSTAVSAELLLSMTVASCLDDHNNLNHRDLARVVQTAMNFGNDAGKERGTADGGLRKRARYAGVYVTSGEQPAHKSPHGQALGGHFARGLVIQRHPMGEAVEGSAEHVANSRDARKIGTVCDASYGHLLPAVASWMLGQHDWIAQTMEEHLDYWTERAQASAYKGSTLNRLCEHLSSISTARLIFREVTGIDLGDEPAEVAWAAAEAGADTARLPVRLLEALAACMAREPARFRSVHAEAAQPTGGWLGFDLGSDRVAFLPQTVRAEGGPAGITDVGAAADLLSSYDVAELAHHGRVRCLVIDWAAAERRGLVKMG